MKLNETDRFYGMKDQSSGYEAIEEEYNFKVQDFIETVEAFRRKVEIAWSKNTAHPDLRDDTDVHRFSSLGQCAPTVRLLKDELTAVFPQFTTRSVHGQVENGNARETSQGHVWLEIPLGEDTVIIDVTPDQREAIGPEAPKLIMGLRSKLEKAGYNYTGIQEDTDELMRHSGSYRRYEILQKRYEKIKQDAGYYKELFDSNVYIVGGTATGKSELARGLEEQYPFEALDVGKLFRVATYLIMNDSDPAVARPDVEKISSNDQTEVDRVVGAVSRKRRLLNEGLIEGTQFVKRTRGEQRILLNGEDVTDKLDTREINILVSTIAQSEPVRAVVWKWIKQFSDKNGQIILTGHTLRDIDSTKFKVIHLTVDDEVGAQRLYDRSADTFVSPAEALQVLQHRNQRDRVSVTTELLDRVHMVDPIATDTIDSSKVRFRALRRLATIASVDANRQQQQTELGLERSKFEWQVNPFLSYIRESGRDIFQAEAELLKEQGVTEFDVAVQTMMHLSGLPISEVWLSSDPVVLADITNLFQFGNTREAAEQFARAISEGRITLNVDVVSEQAHRQLDRLIVTYARTQVMYEGKVVALPASYMGNPDRSPFSASTDPKISKKQSQVIRDPKTNEPMLQVQENGSGKRVVIKKVPKEISDLYGKGFHYLHSGRADEAVAYGAYVEGEDVPFAWVSYSPVDRDYKKDILRHLQVEPHRMLEMTRAWNATWSPKNTMSVLFSFAHDQISAESKRQVDDRVLDKPVAGIVTAINGNLGFRANAFNGVGFETVALKPANFSFYVEDDGSLTYMSRRQIVRRLGLHSTKELDGHPRYRANQVPLLPTNEMVVMFDEREQHRVTDKPIYRIPNSAYSEG